MASVFDAAAYLLQKAGGDIEQMRLHKLLYYAQGWSLGNGRGALFQEPIEAWRNGPVVPALWRQQQSRFRVNKIDYGQASRLQSSERLLLDVIWNNYQHLDGAMLSRITHAESPWLDARKGIEPWQRSDRVISHESLLKFFGDQVTESRTRAAAAIRTPAEA